MSSLPLLAQFLLPAPSFSHTFCFPHQSILHLFYHFSIHRLTHLFVTFFFLIFRRIQPCHFAFSLTQFLSHFPHLRPPVGGPGPRHRQRPAESPGPLAPFLHRLPSACQVNPSQAISEALERRGPCRTGEGLTPGPLLGSSPLRGGLPSRCLARLGLEKLEMSHKSTQDNWIPSRGGPESRE